MRPPLLSVVVVAPSIVAGAVTKLPAAVLISGGLSLSIVCVPWRGWIQRLAGATDRLLFVQGIAMPCRSGEWSVDWGGDWDWSRPSAWKWMGTGVGGVAVRSDGFGYLQCVGFTLLC